MSMYTNFLAEYYVRAYRLAKDGMSNTAIAKNLGVDVSVFAKWLAKKPALAKAVEEGRAESGKDGYRDFRKFAYGRMTPQARKLWDRLEEVEKLDEGKSRRERHDAFCELVATQGMRLRQQLFLHSLVSSNFQVTMACRRVGIAVTEVREWMTEDRPFAELVGGINACKKDFFESSLINLVRNGDTAATIFANKTINRDRGYGEKVQVDIRGEIDHKVSVEGLKLSVEAQRELLDAIRKRREQIEYKGEVIEGELEEKES